MRRGLSPAALCVLICCAGGFPAPGNGPADEGRLREAASLRGEALAAMEDGAYATALPLLERLEELLPDNVLPPVNRAICHLQLGERPAALTAIDRARILAPDNPQVLFATARILAESGEEELFDEVLAAFTRAHPRDPRPSYLRAESLQARARPVEALAALQAAVRSSPENLVLLVDRLVAATDARDAEAAAAALDAVEDRLNGFDGSLADYARLLRDGVAAGDPEALPPPARVVRNLLRPTDLYRQGLLEVAGGRGPGTGLFPQLDFEPPLPRSVQGGRDIPIALREAGIAATGVTALAPVTDAGERDAVWVASAHGIVLWPAQEDRPDPRGDATAPPAPDEKGGPDLPQGDATAPPAVAEEGRADLRRGDSARLAFDGGGAGSRGGALALLAFDLDQDSVPDLLRLDPAGALLFHRGLADGRFDAPRSLRPADPAATGLLPLDVDHDGDLDLLLLRSGRDVYLENHGAGWRERTVEIELGGPERESTDAVSADLDDDGDLDLLVAHGDAPMAAYRNDRTGRLGDAAAAWGLQGLAAQRLAVADFDADGLLDVAALTAGGVTLLRGLGHGFEATAGPELPTAAAGALLAGDFDNDGDTDLLLAGDGGVWLLRNRDGDLVAEPQPVDGRGVVSLTAGDWDGDGDLDVLALTDAGDLRRWDNEGGERNQWLRLRLRGLADNNSKNNTAGLFARIETRSGGDFQLVLGNGAVNHLGLGSRREADVVRVVWTNGLGQTWSRVASNQTLVEEQVLKGSCPFLYAWDGTEFRFVTDLMWKSPLGMPLPDGSQAPHQSARDFVLIRGELLRPAGRELWLQVTEELWEAAYVDRHRLLAVDHPGEIELVVDERFTPPPHAVDPPLHAIGRSAAPVRAVDHRGRNVLARLAARDDRYVGDLPLDRYQGVTRGHSLELTFRDVPSSGRLRLLLWGWTFPTDSSINVALAQDATRDALPPRLAVREDGVWRPLDLWIGFPAGKDKAMVVELTGLVPGGTLDLRLETSMQIYWDAVRLAIGDEPAAWRATWLEPRAADLHYRGFSHLTRSSPESPHRFDYSRVGFGARFRDLAGPYTRYGPVTELLAAEDDRYVVMNAGDEMTVRFDAAGLPALPRGWRRDWVLYTDGWVKDGDLNTRSSATVEPLPHRAMTVYPDPGEPFPETPAHRAWHRQYQTRLVTDAAFREALRRPGNGGRRRP